MMTRIFASTTRAGRRVRGFTFVELSVTLLVVGVLAALALPRYADYRNRARVAQSLNEIAGLEGQVETWRSTHADALPATLADFRPNGMLDPWGQPYVYYNIEANGKGHARKDHALNPLNSDYDLYSVGADGVSKSQITQKDSLDDVIRASNGGFVGLASDF